MHLCRYRAPDDRERLPDQAEHASRRVHATSQAREPTASVSQARARKRSAADVLHRINLSVKTALSAGLLFALVALVACARVPQDELLGTWVNPHVVHGEPAVLQVEFLPKSVMMINVLTAMAVAGWGGATSTTGTYEIIEPGKLLLKADIGSAVMDYNVGPKALQLSGQGVADVLGKATPPQDLVRRAR